MLISFVVSTLTVIICLAFAVPGAYAVARLNFPGRQALSRSILLIYLVPAIVLVIPLYAVFSQLGLRNTLARPRSSSIRRRRCRWRSTCCPAISAACRPSWRRPG